MSRRFLPALLASVVLVPAAVAQDAKPGAKEEPPRVQTFSRTRESSKLGVVVDLRGLVENPIAGHKYVLRYQYRLHTKKGEDGPLLGDALLPSGRSFDVAPMGKPSNLGWRLDNDFGGGPAPGDEDAARAARGVEFAGLVDITRRELTGMTRLPPHAAGVVVRVEPQVFDVTAGKFVTSSRTNGAAVVVETGFTMSPEEMEKKNPFNRTYYGSPIPADKVVKIEAFDDWFGRQFDTPARAGAALRVFGELNSPDVMDEIRAFESALAAKTATPATRALALRALPQRHNHLKSSFPGVVRKLTEDPDAGVREAAEAWLKANK